MRNVYLLLFLLAVLPGMAQEKQLTLEDAIRGRHTYLRPASMEGLSWKNDAVFTWLKSDTLWAAAAGEDGRKPLLDLSALNEAMQKGNNSGFSRFPPYSWTPDELLLIRRNRAFTGIDCREQRVEYRIELPEKAENARFSEPGKYVAYTVDDDLFVTFEDGKTIQITRDGGRGIVSGKEVHRREFGISGGIFIAPEGNSIAFYRKDESMVTDYPVVDFMGRVARHSPVKYPMAGMKSHHVTVGVYHISSGKTVFLKTGGDPEHYLTNLAWAPDEKSVYLFELNRGQDHSRLTCYDAGSGEKIKTLFESTHDAYVEPLHPIRFSKVNPERFYHLSRQEGWFHLYEYTTEGKRIRRITKGDWEVTRVLGFDQTETYVFVEATREGPLERHLYRVALKSGKMEKLTATPGMHHGMLSPGGSWLLDEFSAPSVPSQTGLISSGGKRVRMLHEAADPLEDYKLGENRLVSVPSADGKTTLTGRIILPPDLDPSKKYPVIVYVYGGPHSQLVNRGWHHGARWWQYYMASQGYIAFTMDNRGTNHRGRDFETAVHRRLGILETEDQMKGIAYLKSLPYVDEERIGVHGWSYGGFMTLNLMLRHPEIFKVGVAGGPVVDWSMYEVMYGERYMDRPEENPEGYAETNMLNHVGNLEGDLMLIHGVQDDVVVMQHSMKFLRECIRQNKPVDFFVYPTHPHNVRGGDRLHLMKKVSRYFFDNL